MLEKINKNLLLVALALLMFRTGNFSYSFIPKPYELLFSLVVILTVIHIVWHKQIVRFFLSLPKKVWITLFLLVLSILLGWVVAIYIKHIPTTLNMVLEFGTFVVGLCSMLLVIFYAKQNDRYIKWYFYALLVPAVYGIFVLFHGLTPQSFLLTDGNFVGFTTNVNIVAKILLIPTLFFITYGLYESERKKLKTVYIAIAVILTALLFWISSRGALLSLFLGIFFVWIALYIHDRQWKKALIRIALIALIIVVGFALAPSLRQRVVLNRLFNSDSQQTSYTVLQHQTLGHVLKTSFLKPFHSSTNRQKSIVASTTSTPSAAVEEQAPQDETRLAIWPYYLKIIVRNPFGFGPDTHMQSHFFDKNGDMLSSGPHNTYLEIWLWGGLLGIGSFLFLLYFAFKQTITSLQKKYTVMTLALLTILFVLSITIVFDDSLSLYCFWVVLGLALIV